VKKFLISLLRYLGLGIVAVPLSIVVHELGHFAGYLLLGASNVQLHTASVSADKEMLSGPEQAAVNIIGPLITYAVVGAAYFITKRKYNAFLVILALAAPVGRAVNGVYLYFRMLGYQPKPNFDEFNFADNLGISPLLITTPTTLIVVLSLGYFLRKVWKHGGLSETVMALAAVAAGIAVWFTAGPMLLP
jgi:hypothetical protein